VAKFYQKKTMSAQSSSKSCSQGHRNLTFPFLSITYLIAGHKGCKVALFRPVSLVKLRTDCPSVSTIMKSEMLCGIKAACSCVMLIPRLKIKSYYRKEKGERHGNMLREDNFPRKVKKYRKTVFGVSATRFCIFGEKILLIFLHRGACPSLFRGLPCADARSNTQQPASAGLPQ
jgi:hypothetical protein